MDSKKVWLVTDASKGLGPTLIRELLRTGYLVAATSNNIGSLRKVVDTLEDGPNDNFLPLHTSPVNACSVKLAVEKTLAAFGQIDVVVNNNAGNSPGDINIFGALNVIRQVLPHFRARHGGVIFNIGPTSGYARLAVTGFTEALSAELEPFGIHAVVIYADHEQEAVHESPSPLHLFFEPDSDNLVLTGPHNSTARYPTGTSSRTQNPLVC